MAREHSRQAAPRALSQPFDTRPRAVRRWVASLPLADLDEAGLQLRHALGQVNSRPPSAPALADVLECLGPATSLVLDHLEMRCGHQGQPVERTARGAARLALDLINRTVRASAMQVREQERPRWPWQRSQARRRRALAVHRIFHLAERCVRIHRALHLDLPAGFWRRLHGSYRLAEGEGLGGICCRRPDGGRDATTVDHEYRRLMLVALLPGPLEPLRQTAILMGLDEWTALTRLQSAPVPAAQHMVALGVDQGPRPVGAEGNGEAIRWLDTGALDARLAAAPDEPPGLHALLRACWCKAQKREEGRHAAGQTVAVALGLSALFTHGGGKPLPHETGIPLPGGFVRRAEARDDGLLIGRLIDQGGSGVAIALPAAAVERIAPGMALGMRAEGGEWRVGVVTRLCRRGALLELGARLHLRGLVPVRLRAAGMGAAFEAVAGRDAEGGWSVAGPAVPALRHGDPTLEVEGRGQRLRRERILCQSPHVEILCIRSPEGECIELKGVAPESGRAGTSGLFRTFLGGRL